MKNFISKLFSNNKSKGLTKIEYWEKREFFELIKDLHKAEKLLSNNKGGSSTEFLSADDFYDALIDAIDDIEFGNKIDLTKFYFWFAPTSTWDNFMGNSGLEIGDKIFTRVDKWKKAYS
jgi:hypothetical protein